jgi:hypothetical protein
MKGEAEPIYVDDHDPLPDRSRRVPMSALDKAIEEAISLGYRYRGVVEVANAIRVLEVARKAGRKVARRRMSQENWDGLLEYSFKQLLEWLSEEVGLLK